MPQQETIKLFEQAKIRTVWDEDQEKWFFSVVDVVAVLTDSANPQVYWRVLKNRLAKEGNETVTNCNALKLTAPDSKDNNRNWNWKTTKKELSWSEKD